MYKSKKEVDAHVRTALSKLRTEAERQLRSFTIAKLYYKINEFSSAEHYLCSYLSIKKDNDQAYKLLGQCYEHLKHPEKALEAYQKSLQLNAKQPDLLADVCQLLLDDHDHHMNMNKSKYWCEIAESEKVQHDAVFSLRLKIMNLENNCSTSEVENILFKEISSHPNDVNLRVRLVRHYVDSNKIHDAYNYIYDLEILHRNDLIDGNSDWCNIMQLTLSRYEQLPNVIKDWNFWLVKTTCLERQVQKAFLDDNPLSEIDNTHTIVEIANYLFNFDQHLYKVSLLTGNLNVQKQLFDFFLNHYRGQLLLHLTALVFKREQFQNKTKWKDIVRLMLPLLLLAYQATQEEPQLRELWMKHCDEKSKELILKWQKEGSFRCAQVGRILLSCVNDNLSYNNHDDSTMRNKGNHLKVLSDLWSDDDQVICQIRQICSNPQWRRNIFALLFCSSEQKLQEQTSFLINDMKIAEPTYELPTYSDVENYEEAAKYLHPQSLKHLVYLCLGNKNLANVRASVFGGLNFSTQNLAFCGAESLNQLDVDSFLYAAVLQSKRQIEVEHDHHNHLIGKPPILTYANLHSMLCTEEQCRWWHMAYMMYKNLSNMSDLAQLRASLQNGIEIVRGINGPKMDITITFKLGQIFVARAEEVVKPVEKLHLEVRAKSLYKNGLNMLKMRNKGILEPFHKYFKYGNQRTSAVDRELFSDAEKAVTYLASHYFKKAEYEDLIEEFTGTQLPFATYLQAEAYRKLNDATQATKKSKAMYLNKVSEYLNLTLSLLESNTCIDCNHPLNSIIHNEIKKVQQAFVANNVNRSNYFSPQDNSSAYEDAESDLSFEKRLDSDALNGDKSEQITRRNRSLSLQNQELLEYVKKLSSNLGQLKKEILDILKSEFKEIKSSISCTKEEMQQLEMAIKKLQLTSNPPIPCNEKSNTTIDELHVNSNHFLTQPPQSAVSSNNHFATNHQYLSTIKPFGGHNSTTIQTHMGAGLIRYPQPNPALMEMQSNPNMDAYNAQIFSPHLGNYPLKFLTSNQGNAFYPQVASMQARQQMNPPCIPSLSYTDSAITNALNFNVAPFTSPNMFTSNITTEVNSRLNNNMLCNAYQQSNIMNAKANSPFLPFPSAGMPLMPMPMPIPPAATTTAINFKSNTSNNDTFANNLPANVVITSSDPLPNPNNTILQSQSLPVLSVNIPSCHIKSGMVNKPILDVDAKITSAMTSLTASSIINIKNVNSKDVEGAASVSVVSANRFTQMPVSTNRMINAFSPISTINLPHNTNENACNTNISAEVNADADEYDPRPDFKGIIPLPDEIEVHTGEEDEEVMFCYRAKLFRRVDKEWKERGIGDIKILKSKDGTSRILMRRDQTHKICANHKITPEITLTTAKNENRGFIWVANDFADETLQLETFFLRFKLPETAMQFQDAFKTAQQSINALNNEIDEVQQDADPFKPVDSFPSIQMTTIRAPKTLTDNKLESSFNFFTSTPFNKSEKSLGSMPPMHGNLNSSVGVGDPVASTAICTSMVTLFTSTNPIPTKPNMTNFSFGFSLPNNKNTPIQQGDNHDSSSCTTTATMMATSTSVASAFGNIFSNLNKSNNSPFSPGKISPIFTTSGSNDVKDVTQADKAVPTTAVSSTLEDTADFKSVTEQTKLPSISRETTKISMDLQKEKIEMPSSGFDRNVGGKLFENFGDIFKPKPGSWYCKQCYVCNGSEELLCVACNTPMNEKAASNSINAVTKAFTSGKMNFKFGFADKQISSETVSTSSVVPGTTSENQGTTKAAEALKTSSLISTNLTASQRLGSTVGFGDKFKPKAGSWICEDCYLANTSDAIHCKACNSLKNKCVPPKGNIPPKTSGSLNVSSKFVFGFNPPNADNESTTSGIKFDSPTIGSNHSRGSIDVPTTTSAQSPFAFNANFAVKPAGEGGSLFGKIGENVPALNSFSVDKKEFNFTLKPKSPGKSGKCPMKEENEGGDSSDRANADGGDGSYIEEENNTYFVPVIPLPDKIEVKTGEEDEDVLYEHRAKLYRFIDGEWKERGLGDLKILCHKKSRKLRVVMRRESVLKICLNHVLNDDLEYKRKDEKSWLFAANDFSEGEFELHKFSLRFKNKEIADGFMEAIKQALSDKAKSLEIISGSHSSATLTGSPTSLSHELKSTADRLQLPYEFFLDNQNCAGCCGCNPEDYMFTTHITNDIVNSEEIDSLEYPLTLPVLSVPLESVLLKKPIIKGSILSQGLMKNASCNIENGNLKMTPANHISPFKSTAFHGPVERNASAISETTLLSANENLFKSNSKNDKDKALEKPLFGTATTISYKSDTNLFSGKSIFANSTSSNFSDSIFGSNSNKGKLDFGNFTFNSFGPNSTSTEAKATVSSNSNIFDLSRTSTAAIDFATLAVKATEVSMANTKSDSSKPVGGFIGLINQNAFGSFSNAQKTEEKLQGLDIENESNNKKESNGAEEDNVNYDPHYDPIIALPDEIVISTGEEEETKLFGERAKLFRWDETKKEWKERGVGELKILLHPKAQSYRMILRREQIHKLVLNHTIGSTFVINKMAMSPKDFTWAAMNFAESSTGVLEKFAVRFKNEALADSFYQTVEDCILKRKQLEE